MLTIEKGPNFIYLTAMKLKDDYRELSMRFIRCFKIRKDKNGNTINLLAHMKQIGSQCSIRTER